MRLSANGRRLMDMHKTLLETFGPQHWWPAETPFEVAVGAILTQSVSWKNVERAIAALKRAGLMDASRIAECDAEKLMELIRPSGYFKAKTVKLQAFVNFLLDCFGGEIEGMRGMPKERVRERLLGVHGIGPETADAILCYALGHPSFVADAYSRRILLRNGVLAVDSYEAARVLVEGALPSEPHLFNEFHALLVRLAKVHCQKGLPRCQGCPLEGCHRIGLPDNGEASGCFEGVGI